jgi:Rrf2 family transcriptional regulator, cysteine metabolism repressor
MKLSRTITYAIHAMLQLGKAEDAIPIPCSQLSKVGKLPERFLLQVLRNLVTHGLLNSTRGVEGGYYLARQPEQITLCDIVEAFDNPLNSKFPGLPDSPLPQQHEVMVSLEKASRAARVELRKLTLADLLTEHQDDT